MNGRVFFLMVPDLGGCFKSIHSSKSLRLAECSDGLKTNREQPLSPKDFPESFSTTRP